MRSKRRERVGLLLRRDLLTDKGLDLPAPPLVFDQEVHSDAQLLVRSEVEQTLVLDGSIGAQRGVDVESVKLRGVAEGDEFVGLAVHWEEADNLSLLDIAPGRDRTYRDVP